MEQADETLGGEGESGDLSLRLFKEKANAKGPIYACYNFVQSLPHVLNTFFFQVPKRTPHKIKLEECEQKQKKKLLFFFFTQKLLLPLLVAGERPRIRIGVIVSLALRFIQSVCLVFSWFAVSGLIKCESVESFSPYICHVHFLWAWAPFVKHALIKLNSKAPVLE